MSLSLETATAILEVAREGGYLEDDLPEDEDEIIEDAEFYLQHARAAAETEAADETIEKIVAIGDAPEQGYEVEEKEAPPVEKIKGENLPIPHQIEGDPPVMPRDTSELKDKEVRRLMGEFNACLARATWLLKDVTDDVLRLKQLRAAEFRRWYIEEEQAARGAGIKLTKEALEIATSAHEEVIELDDKLYEAERQQREYKALKEIYQGNIDRLSREGTLRDDEARRDGRRK